MGRWRAPSPRSSPYITAAGFKILQAEIETLWRRRREVTAALAAAAAEGDRSENAEYIYRKKELREIDRRIRYLQKRMPSLTVVSEMPAESRRIFFGAWVTLKKSDGNEVTYRIVGADEIDAAGGKISIDSPLARALLKKTVDDEVAVRVANGQCHYLVVDVRYEKP